MDIENEGNIGRVSTCFDSIYSLKVPYRSLITGHISSCEWCSVRAECTLDLLWRGSVVRMLCTLGMRAHLDQYHRLRRVRTTLTLIRILVPIFWGAKERF